jgi:hypothetical protein
MRRAGTRIGHGARDGETRLVLHIPENAAQRAKFVTASCECDLEIIDAQNRFGLLGGRTPLRFGEDALEPACSFDSAMLRSHKERRRQRAGRERARDAHHVAERGTVEKHRRNQQNARTGRARNERGSQIAPQTREDDSEREQRQ